MKKTLLLSALTLAVSVAGARATPLGDFNARATEAALKPFALDLGGVLGGASFHSGRVLGMPGFDIGVVGTMQFRPDKDDLILRDGGADRFGLPLVQAEIGLPMKIDVIAHGISGAGTRVYGGGLRYGVHKSAKLSPIPDVSVSAFGDKVNQTYFSAYHYSANATVSVGLPVVKPYLGAGYDYTEVKVGSAANVAAGTKAVARGSRFSLGVDVSPAPLFHVYGAYTLLHGIPGVDLGLGARF